MILPVMIFKQLKLRLLIIALAVLAAALVSAFYFTWRKARHNKLPVWDLTAKRLTINMLIPLVAGGLFILAMYQYNEWKFIAPACLIFYGLALVNASKYTLTDVKYLGLLQILLGIDQYAVCRLWTVFLGGRFWRIAYYLWFCDVVEV